MHYKVEGAVRRNKRNLIIFLVLWVILTIVLVMPMGYSLTQATVNGQFNIGKFFDGILKAITNLGQVIPQTFTEQYIGNFIGVLWKFTMIYIVFILIGLIRTAPKNRYTDIEHGSSDWAQGGEQYRILSNRKGIILAQNNYLPVDKRGNVNVLVVGRFRFW